MDELAAAAAVVEMSIDDNAGADMEQPGTSNTVSADNDIMAATAAMAEEKENTHGRAAVGNTEDAPSKVICASLVPLRTRCV